jgi:tRNA pseudouridine38-40 synthase
MSVPFTSEEIAAEERRPKRKVAVMIGYAGTGYHGIQINHRERTIEGELFAAFVAAGAIAKTNADDPKKSSLVRCARTDKGVHAAGNVLSLKMIIEDENIVEKINSHLPAQIRVWSIQRTNNAFNCWQACDSRWYEYLMPSYALLPPHPRSFLGKKIVESAKQKGVLEEYVERLNDVRGFWDGVEKNDIQPVLDRLDPTVRKQALEVLRASEDRELEEEGAAPGEPDLETSDAGRTKQTTSVVAEAASQGRSLLNERSDPVEDATTTPATDIESAAKEAQQPRELTEVELAVREIKAAYVRANRRYRATPTRLQKLQSALDLYVGTRNYHNYTVFKSFKDASAKRHIKTFVVDPKPIPIRDTEWLSIKVHGQSFMMHQIRKMVAMAVMVTRCGAPIDLIQQSYGPRRISIPKVPGLGLMLERPMFADYNKRATQNLGREAIDFTKYERQIREFKDREIYSRMFDVEEKENA